MATIVHEKVGQQARLRRLHLRQGHLECGLQNTLPLRSRMRIRVLPVK